MKENYFNDSEITIIIHTLIVFHYVTLKLLIDKIYYQFNFI